MKPIRDVQKVPYMLDILGDDLQFGLRDKTWNESVFDLRRAIIDEVNKMNWRDLSDEVC